MYVSEFLRGDASNRITSLSYKSTTYPISYNFWVDSLFERIMKLFIWECDPVPQREIESRLILNGTCGITEYENELTAFFGSISGITKYYDTGTHYSVFSPVYADYLEIDKEVIVINNNSLFNPVFPLIHQYAVLLAHADVTLNWTLVNMRDVNGKPVAGTTKVTQSIKQYQDNLINGKIGVINDPAFIGAKFTEGRAMTNNPLKDIIETRRNLLNSFYADIGVKTTWNKKGNMIREEVNGDDSMLLYNISDMLATRKEGCEKVNNRYGVKWAVKLNPELKYEGSDESEVQSE